MANITINSTATRVQYVATASQTVFAYTFPIKADADLKVYQRSSSSTADDATDLLTLTTHYTVSGANTASGGNVTLVTGATVGDIVTIVGDKAVDRSAIYNQSVTLSKSDLNNDFNDNVMYDKQMYTFVDQIVPKYNRSERVSDSYRSGKLELPMLNDNDVWIGRGNDGDSPDDITTINLATDVTLLSVDYVIGTANSSLASAQVLGSLATGMLYNTTAGSTGTVSIATEGTDYYQPGGTDVAVVDGGTGASTGAQAAINLGIAASVQNETWTFDVDTGAADAYVVTLSPAPASYTGGLAFTMEAANDNTGASTINVNGLGAIPLVLHDGTALIGKNIKASGIYQIVVNNAGTSAFLVDPETIAVEAQTFYDATSLQKSLATVASNGTTITLTYQQDATGDLTLFFSTGEYELDCTPALTVTLTAGTDAAPTTNYIYILESTKALTVSTSSWPAAAEHLPVATVLCQSAASMQTQGAYSIHNWSENVVSDATNNGHMSDINYWIRQQPATWVSGAAITPTAGVSTLDFAVATGTILQLHEHTYPAIDTGGGDFALCPNDNGGAYTSYTDLSTLLTDSGGTTMSNKRYNLVVWGVISNSSGDCQLMVNVPSDSYNSDNACINDSDATSVYTIPDAFADAGFLIARVSIRHVNSSSTWSILATTDLRGLQPANAPGAGHSGISALEDDTTPTLAGNLDLSSFGLVDTNGNEQLLFTATGSAVNEFTMVNAATGNAVNLRATGDDSDISIEIQPKGTGNTILAAGSLQFAVSGESILDANSNEQIVFNTTPSAVNRLTVANAATGNAPQIQATGDDTNIPLLLSPKNTGNVLLSDGTDTTKLISFELAGATTAKTMTFTSSHTDDRTITLPDVTGTVWSSGAENVNTSQPAFLAYNSSTDSNVTGAGTNATVDFDTEVFDNGSDFASDTFTAPVTGRYHLSAAFRLSGLTSAMTDGRLKFVTSNRTYFFCDCSPYACMNVSTELSMMGSTIVDMDAADTVTVQAQVANGAGDTADIIGGNAVTFFGGELIC